MIVKVVLYKCNRCGKQYATEPEYCECESRLEVGRIVGPFKILEITNSQCKCQCQICGMVKLIHRSNIARQASCGCKPRHIEILQFMGERLRYRCRTCGEITIDNMPIELWCCE